MSGLCLAYSKLNAPFFCSSYKLEGDGIPGFISGLKSFLLLKINEISSNENE
jgi:hypothetical protein